MPKKSEKPKHPWEHAEMRFQLLYWSERDCQNWIDAAEQVRSLVCATAKRFLIDLADGDEHEIAKDITQEFLREALARIFVTYDPARPFFAYGYESLWHICVGHCRRLANQRLPGFSDEPIDDRCNPVRAASKHETRGMVGRALWQIPKRDRRLVHQYYWKRLSASDIARLRGSTENAVFIQLNRVRKKLKGLLVHDGEFFD